MGHIYKIVELEAKKFARDFSKLRHTAIFGVNDGKSIGTYIENSFKDILVYKYGIAVSSSSKGIDLPEIRVDIKSTLYSRPQSSCPYRSYKQKIYGLGYGLLIFAYEKIDLLEEGVAILDIKDVCFIPEENTGDYTLTRNILELIRKSNILDDMVLLLKKANFQESSIDYEKLAEDVIKNPPSQGHITISNALQWRLNYGRVIGT